MKKHLFALLLCGTGALAHAQAPSQSGYLTLDQYEVRKSTPMSTAPSTQLFEVVRGASLRATLERWVRNAGWQPLVWQLPEDTDFTLGASARFEGDLVSATRHFIEALGAEANLRVRFNHANRLVTVEPLQ